ncbi:HAD family phosphatase [Variovorax sp. J22G73]|uniref:HAD family hydrolase n=1 Tax=unclassified Variovorax TaxID=663243 RepID=UPI0025786093|nr:MULTISPECIES: HAD family phosphatase [unclassified Variovorax]MDM0004563.1 HAD family phosphatase [Variovorax sp. J22R203]MDM0095771.1 HAD family phosphatase [Variovorax sp. J22G73]
MNVVFDLGAVLFAWEPTRLVQTHLAPHAPTEAAAAALGRALFHHDDWTSFDCGTRTLNDAIARMSARLALPAEALHTMLEGLGERLEPIGVTVGMLEELISHRDAGQPLRLYYLSNMPAPYARAIERRHAFMRRFDGGVFSGDVKFLKPEREIYEVLAMRHGLDPEQTVFIDDSAANVEMARAFGWHAIHCTAPATLPSQLQRYLPVNTTLSVSNPRLRA